MKKRALCILAIFSILLCGCTKTQNNVSEPKGKVYYSFFDTVSYIYSYANDSAERFDTLSAECAHILREYHEFFDIYHEYEGVNNLCTLNKNAGIQPVILDERLIDFLTESKNLYYVTDGEMNVMMGSVLSLWHEAREDGTYIPDEESLKNASFHTDIENLIIEGNTAFIKDKESSIDVGAFAKGYATQKAADYLIDNNADSYVLNIGGNICIIGNKPDNTGWSTAIKDPKNPSESFCEKLYISDISCVTSGVYERFFTVDGVKYHHIIDKDTLYPSTYYDSVTVLCKDSGIADALSTALFCMDEKSGTKLAQEMNAQVLWVYPDGTKSMTPGMGDYIEEE